ncbi:hypothetical protein L21SP2_0697 [Salinispira pacifica]|uniref:Uncharacterized protein n=1 Tax=Salinispira pacifica TaxID=1307761 RepID=V5WF10_9SPIO|nr:hypothetical protein L21SP2_0697 [Salinispira pacifica]
MIRRLCFNAENCQAPRKNPGVRKNAIYLDMELKSDRGKIESDPELFLSPNPGRMICLDEIRC